MVDVAKVKMFGMNVGSFSWDYAYNPNGAWTNTHQMSINGKYDNITR